MAGREEEQTQADDESAAVEVKVTDKRRFTDLEEPASEPSTSEAKQAKKKMAEVVDDAAEDATAAQGESRSAGAGLPAIDFTTLVLSLFDSALIHLGLRPDPDTGTATTNLDAARYQIDMLALLKEKTVGNLTADESSLLTSALYDLRLAYVRKCQEKEVKA